MPIPNVTSLYQRIHFGSEGGHEFARFMKLLLHSHYEKAGKRFVAESDASGDYKHIDAFFTDKNSIPELFTGFQFKYYPAKLNAGHKKEIRETVEAAIAANKLMKEFILVTPEEFTKELQIWWEDLKARYALSYSVEKDGICTFFTLQLTHWGHSKIIELALRNDHIGRHYFPELFPIGMGTFRLSYAGIDDSKSNWTPSQEERYSYSQSHGEKNIGLTSDPVFDFQFTNSTNDILLLHSIEVHIEKVSTAINGIPAEYIFKSIGTIEYTIDFDQPINYIDLDDPIIFNSNKPFRFNLQLKEFTQKVHGNCVLLKFWFNFDRYTIPSESFYLSF